MVVVVGQAITDPISAPSFDFTFTIGPELDKNPLPLLKIHFPKTFKEESDNNTQGVRMSHNGPPYLSVIFFSGGQQEEGHGLFHTKS